MKENRKIKWKSNDDCCEQSKIFIEILSNISSKLVNINLRKEYLIEECLEKLGKKTNSCRAYIFLFRNNLEYMDNVYEWCAKGISSEKNNLQDLKTSLFPWWMNELKNNKIIIIENVEKMTAEIEKEILSEQGIKSLIVLPICYKDNLVGYVGLDNNFQNKSWNEDTQFLLKLISEMLSGALARLDHEKELEYAAKELIKNEKNIHSLKAQLIQQEEMLKLSQSKELSKPIGLSKEDFNEIINYVLDILSFDMMIFDKIHLNLSENLPSILCNKIEISQVIMNILKNAIYEMNKKIEFLGGNKETNTNILKIETYSEDNFLVCEISDNGMGFSDEIAPKLFEPFFTTKPFGLGTGLGLSLAYDIITHKHNGQIIASESEWKGAKFTIKLCYK
ncbi:GAF domain-containing sensor histidine kinase [Clostridium botulinum]|uniref:GAF domain-containing sensor histidine kinase n=1 Tax=Clostridium botulinum TaxID=1491 RepID=UPI001A91BF99|nr:GAF domain-containing sensor histidine kinase [Clostridium botulinum]MBO0529553.1 GAF domain-containing sensor histidine kinase [Clostridium botulinum]MBO0530499.1 GAF domain-containing sensor histidine kinase [Clostridium botulinum]MBO0538768.1 GAF domain-containing sensor histidine kinase [Clostridium botulinum]MBO0541743.1 GAF domain-containing sensor histidine kinase [Clostridium botulinum]MBO0547427.1 GAF domain-containing sensor histidine kinase [Clostridium botulinum]